MEGGVLVVRDNRHLKCPEAEHPPRTGERRLDKAHVWLSHVFKYPGVRCDGAKIIARARTMVVVWRLYQLQVERG